MSTLLRWSRRSAADVMREYFDTDALQAPGLLVGPMVWGISPELPGSGLGALTYAMRHAGHVGRPVGGAGQVPLTVLKAFEAAGGPPAHLHQGGSDHLRGQARARCRARRRHR